MFIRPREFWKTARKEKITVKQLVLQHLLIVAAIPVIFSFIDNAFIGQWHDEVGHYTSFTYALFSSLIFYINYLLFVFISAITIKFLAPKFHGRASLLDGMKLMTYAVTPFFIGGVLNVFASYQTLSIVRQLFALHSLLFFMVGMPRMTRVPETHHAGFLFACILSITTLLILAFVLQYYFIPQQIVE